MMLGFAMGSAFHCNSGGTEGQNPASPRCDRLASYWPPLRVFMKGKTKSIKDQEKALEARYK